MLGGPSARKFKLGSIEACHDLLLASFRGVLLLLSMLIILSRLAAPLLDDWLAYFEPVIVGTVGNITAARSASSKLLPKDWLEMSTFDRWVSCDLLKKVLDVPNYLLPGLADNKLNNSIVVFAIYFNRLKEFFMLFLCPTGSTSSTLCASSGW